MIHNLLLTMHGVGVLFNTGWAEFNAPFNTMYVLVVPAAARLQ